MRAIDLKQAVKISSVQNDESRYGFFAPHAKCSRRELASPPDIPSPDNNFP